MPLVLRRLGATYCTWGNDRLSCPPHADLTNLNPRWVLLSSGRHRTMPIVIAARVCQKPACHDKMNASTGNSVLYMGDLHHHQCSTHSGPPMERYSRGSFCTSSTEYAVVLAQPWSGPLCLSWPRFWGLVQNSMSLCAWTSRASCMANH
jgi:hypothetical protein